MPDQVENPEDRFSHNKAHFCLFTEVDSPVPEEAEEEVCDVGAALNCLRLFAIPALTGPALTPAGKQWLCDRYVEAALNCLRLFAIPALTGPALTPAGKQWLCDRYVCRNAENDCVFDYCKFENFLVAFILQIFYFQIICEFLKSQASIQLTEIAI